MTKTSRWWACELPHRPIDAEASWHEVCDGCEARLRADPAGEGRSPAVGAAAVAGAEARIAADQPRPGDHDLVRRWRLAQRQEPAQPRRRPVRKEGSTRVDSLRRAIADVGAVLAMVEYDGIEQPVVDHALARMRADRPGPAAVSYEGSGRSAPGGSKPPSGVGQDRGGAALADAEKAATALAKGARELRRKVEGWTPHEPSQSARDAAAATSAPECAWTRAKLHKHEPAYRTGDVGGILDKPMALCRWVYDFVLTHERLPNDEEMDRHDRQLRVLVRVP